MVQFDLKFNLTQQERDFGLQESTESNTEKTGSFTLDFKDNSQTHHVRKINIIP